jgi:NAD(P)-dependent dehydrogenase (short-subunit alcohol dehydrogenase family)
MTRYSDLQGKTVLLTGGAQGIGAATITAFLQQGATVFFCDRDAAAGRRLIREHPGSSLHFTPLDLVDGRAINQWVVRVVRTARRIDVLVNNAAIDPRVAIEDLDDAQWQRQFEVNVHAGVRLIRAALPMLKKGASIINFSSITFHTAPARMSAYVAGKGAIIALSRSLARELGPRGIRVNTVSPGWIMTERQLRDYITPAVKKLIRKSQCVPDLLQPEEIAEVVLFLASEASRAITGQEILADRGWAHS